MNHVFIIIAINKYGYEFNEQKIVYNVRLQVMLIFSIADLYINYMMNMLIGDIDSHVILY